MTVLYIHGDWIRWGEKVLVIAIDTEGKTSKYLDIRYLQTHDSVSVKLTTSKEPQSAAGI